MTSQVEQLEMKPTAKTSALSNSPVGKIIVVDDELELKNILVEALSARGFEVTSCNSGQQVLEELRQKEFDLLLTDLMMPEMDGITLLEAALKVDPHLIGIMMTGQGTIQTAVDAMKVGAFDYVLKPFLLQTVLPVLTRAINARRLRMENLQLRETVAIYSLCQTIAFTLDPQTVLSKLADAALQQSDADEVSILLPTNEGTELYVAAVRGEKRERLLGERVPLQESISSWVARERTPLILNGEVQDDRFVALWPRPEIRSAVSVPMQVANKLVGIINLNLTNRLRPFTLGQMKALTILASTAAAALESASLYTRVRTTEEKYRSIFENATEGLFQSTAAGRVLTANPALARILGYDSPEDMISTITDLSHQLYVNPEDREEAGRLQEAAGALAGFEMEAYRKGGEKIWVSVNRRSVRNQSGEVLYFEGSVEDITDRKRAESELKESGERYRDLVENAHDLIYEHDLRGNFTASNKAGEQITGYSLEETLKLNLAQTVAPECLEKAQEMLRRKLAGESVTVYELVIVGKDGRRVPVEVNTRLVFKDGVPVGVQGIARDITERKRAEEELRDSEERYRLLFDSNPQPMWVYDLETLAFLAVNESAVNHYGYSREEFLAMTIKDIRPAEDVHALLNSLSSRSGNVDSPLEWKHLKKDGTIIEVEITSHLLEFDARQAELILVHDITERTRLETALLASEEQLRQSQKLEAIGQLAGGVAHDFNNLLTVIGGYSSILLGKLAKESPYRVSVEEIKKASDRASGLTRQLLAFSRKQILQPKVLDLNVVVTDLEKMVRRLIGEDIDLLTITSPLLGKVKADPGQIEQVLLNLIVNARDAMPMGGKVTIETRNVVHSEDYAQRHATLAGSYVMLAVSDNGTGMDATVQPRIFDPFFTTKDSGKGTGLGLATVYGIVKQSGGNIWVYSEVGRGSTFKVYLPRVDEAITDNSGPLKSTAKGTETVLVVEDEDQVRLILTEILTNQGYLVLPASNGEQALLIARDPDLDIKLLITDVVMPQMSGRELAERVSEARPNLPILFMSGYTDDAIVRHGLLDDKLNFIQKPFDSTSVARKVREVLDSSP